MRMGSGGRWERETRVDGKLGQNKKSVAVKHEEHYEDCCDEFYVELGKTQVQESGVKEVAQSHYEPLDRYLHQCAKKEIKAQTLMLEELDVAQGILKLVDKFWVKTLVMGAASDKHYSKNMKVPQSKKAIKLMENAHPFCEIWFVCNQKLVFTRFLSVSFSQYNNMNDQELMSVYIDAGEGFCDDVENLEAERYLGVQVDNAQMVSGQANVAQNLEKTHKQIDSAVLHDADDRVVASHAKRFEMTLPAQESDVKEVEILHQQPKHKVTTSEWSNTSKEMAELLEQNKKLSIERDAAVRDITMLEKQKKQMMAEWNFSIKQKQKRQVATERDSALEEIEIFHKQQAKTQVLEELQNEMEWMRINSKCADGDLVKLQKKIRHATVAQDNVLLGMKMFRKKKEQAKMEGKELKGKKQHRKRDLITPEGDPDVQHKLEEQVLTEKENVVREIELLRREKHDLTTELDHVAIQLMEAHRDKMLMMSEHDRTSELAKELTKRLEQIMSERDNAVRKMAELRERGVQSSQFTVSELLGATQDFNDTFKVGLGGSAVVYKGFLWNTTVAIKMLSRDSSSRNQSEFNQEVTILNRVRHPNIVTLMGACSEVRAVVYEFMPNGSLEDHLEGKARAPPLPWQVRTRIIAEICSALSFLHKNKPNAVAHGDIKPGNILLDYNLVSKLSDFGMSQLLSRSGTTDSSAGMYYTSHPWGTVGYMDPEFQTTGELTPQTDTYSIGVTILRVLTAKSPLNLQRVVQNALDRGDLTSVMDTSAGEWPIRIAMPLALLALRCTDRTREMRPDMAGEIWNVVKRLANVAAGEASAGSRRQHGIGTSVPLNWLQVPIAEYSPAQPCKCLSGIKIQIRK